MGVNAVDQPFGMNSDCLIQLSCSVDDKSYPLNTFVTEKTEEVTRHQE